MVNVAAQSDPGQGLDDIISLVSLVDGITACASQQHININPVHN
jgi:hypothetical protein